MEEKAKEIANKMFNGTPFDYEENEDLKIEQENARRCALICVDETIEAFEQAGKGDCTTIHIVDYWQEVKAEIKNL